MRYRNIYRELVSFYLHCLSSRATSSQAAEAHEIDCSDMEAGNVLLVGRLKPRRAVVKMSLTFDFLCPTGCSAFYPNRCP